MAFYFQACAPLPPQKKLGRGRTSLMLPRAPVTPLSVRHQCMWRLLRYTDIYLLTYLLASCAKTFTVHTWSQIYFSSCSLFLLNFSFQRVLLFQNFFQLFLRKLENAKSKCRVVVIWACLECLSLRVRLKYVVFSVEVTVHMRKTPFMSTGTSYV